MDLHPADLAPNQRRTEIASILAWGYLRWRVSRFAVDGKMPDFATAGNSRQKELPV
jgi:hypothetical protein